MQAPTPSQRSIQRRSPAADSGPPPSVPPRAVSPGSAQVRPSASSSSTRSANPLGEGRKQNISSDAAGKPITPISQIEKSVTNLLVATKQLLETLTQWSRRTASDAQVSDVYVRLGYEFNIACRAFGAINVDTTDLGNVPDLLRNILEATLSQEASVESLDRYLPKIRDIIISLLHGLKRKQTKLRQKQAREGLSPENDGSLPRNGSVSSTGSGDTGLTTLLNEGLNDGFGNVHRSSEHRETRENRERLAQEAVGVPPRTSSAASSPSRRIMPARDPSHGSLASEQSSLSSTTMQNIPVMQPGEGLPTISVPNQTPIVDAFPRPPLPQSNQNEAFAALQQGGDLERRASRRYSAYQISKHLGSSPGGVPILPAAQNSPAPNRGRELRESMNAVRGRGTGLNRQISSQSGFGVGSPSRMPHRVSETAAVDMEATSSNGHRAESGPSSISHTNAPEASSQQPINGETGHQTAIVSGFETGQTRPALSNQPRDHQRIELSDRPMQDGDRGAQTDQSGPVSDAQGSPPPDNTLTLFLQYKTKIKKCVLDVGDDELSLARLQLAFIEKFVWNTSDNGGDLPDIYIQDPVSGIRHELEDFNDIKDRSVLVLNVEPLDEVRRHIDDRFIGLQTIVEGFKMAIDDQRKAVERVLERQQETAREVARVVHDSIMNHLTTSVGTSSTLASEPVTSVNPAHLVEVRALKNDLAAIRTTFSSFQADMQQTVSSIRVHTGSNTTDATVSTAQDIVADTSVITAITASSSVQGELDRTYLTSGMQAFSDDLDKVLVRIDEMQDGVEDLRKDVVLRGVRPLPRQLEAMGRDIAVATQEVKKINDHLKREKPLWTKVWENELETVCQERGDLTTLQELAKDLVNDVEAASKTLNLVERATKEQLKDNPGGSTIMRGTPRLLNHVSSVDPAAAKEGMLGEVRALHVDTKGRLNAIAKAEKLRRKELESRDGGDFQKELGTFVAQGRLKKAGGYEEIERARKAKDDEIRREVWERMNGVISSDIPNTEDAATVDEVTDVFTAESRDDPSFEGLIENDALHRNQS